MYCLNDLKYQKCQGPQILRNYKQEDYPKIIKNQLIKEMMMRKKKYNL